MDARYVELQEEPDVLETPSWEPLRSVPTEMVTDNCALAAAASEEQGHWREIGYARKHDADETFLAPWTTSDKGEWHEQCECAVFYVASWAPRHST
eukprot:1193592-Pyramimonas_sp.AAC.1